eukprot:524387-Amorphochlora_amoeboformis.AAC.2
MGGHGGLNILHHKSWNVYGKRQRKKVREDEEKFAKEEEEKKRQKEKEESQERLKVLRTRAQGRTGIPQDFLQSESAQAEQEETSLRQSSPPRSVGKRSSRGSTISTGIKFIISEEQDESVGPSRKSEERKMEKEKTEAQQRVLLS